LKFLAASNNIWQHIRILRYLKYLNLYAWIPDVHFVFSTIRTKWGNWWLIFQFTIDVQQKYWYFHLPLRAGW
jgi:hypothetical protein